MVRHEFTEFSNLFTNHRKDASYIPPATLSYYSSLRAGARIVYEAISGEKANHSFGKEVDDAVNAALAQGFYVDLLGNKHSLTEKVLCRVGQESMELAQYDKYPK